MKKVSKKISQKKEMTNNELAHFLVGFLDKNTHLLETKIGSIETKVNSLETKMEREINKLSLKINREIDEMGRMVARGFDETVSKKDLTNLEMLMRGMFQEINTRIDQMKFNHDQRINVLEDKVLIHKNIFESKLKIKVPQ